MKDNNKTITELLTNIEKEIERVDMQGDVARYSLSSSDELYMVASNYYDIQEKLNTIKNQNINMSKDLATKVDALIKSISKKIKETENLAGDLERRENSGYGI